MTRTLLPIALIAGFAFAPFCVHAEDKLILKSVSVELPNSDRMFPDGPGSQAANGNCLACHSAGPWTSSCS